MRKGKVFKSLMAMGLTAVLAVTAVFGTVPGISPEKASAAVSGNLSRVMVHDPSIIVGNDGTYYAFGTHITTAKSSDLANWTIISNGYQTPNNTHFGNLSQNLAESFKWAGDHDSDCKNGFAVWAPHVIWNENYVNTDGTKGAYMMYYSVSSTYCRSAIGFAVSKEIDKNYQYAGTLVYSGFTKVSAFDNDSKIDKIYTNTNIDELIADGTLKDGYNNNWSSGNTYNTDYAPNAIDPTLFYDTDGKLWMTYGSWSGGIYLLELNPQTGKAIYPGKNGKTEDGRVIDEYFGIRIAGGHTISGEGPFILYDAETDYYYLYMTYEYLDSSSGYNMRLFRSKKPEGPYLDAAGKGAVLSSRTDDHNKYGIKVMGNYKFDNMSKAYKSPGHNSAFIDKDGQRYLLYHTRFSDSWEMFELRVHQQFINEKGWPVTAVFENRGDSISKTGYAEDEIVGTYEYINHGTGSNGNGYLTSKAINLNADGTISGNVTGTWKETDNSYLATFVINNVTYNGVFFKQQDESGSHEMTMTFTAIGDNNETIWGVKNDSASNEPDVDDSDDSDDDDDDDDEELEVGSEFEMPSGAFYKVTKAGDNPTLSYSSPKNSNVTTANIPAKITVNGISCKVTGISANAFKNCKKLKTVTIGSNVSKIGKQAFYGCTAIQKITIKTTKLKAGNVGSKAFQKVPAKAVLKLPKAKAKQYKKILQDKGLGKK